MPNAGKIIFGQKNNMFDGKININFETVNKAIDALGNALKPITKPASEELGLYLAENIKIWRVKRQIKNVAKVVDNCKKAGFSPKQLNLKVLFPYLENVSLEEDEKMQDRWSDLITNYVDPNKNLTLTVYPEILKQVSTPEIEVLRHQYNLSKENNHFKLPITIKDNFLLYNGFSISVTMAICSNLERLGLLKEQFKDTRDFHVNDNMELIMTTDDEGTLIGKGSYVITNFGKEFIKSCTRE